MNIFSFAELVDKHRITFDSSVPMHCKGKDEKKPTYQVLQVGDKLMDSCWVEVFQERSRGC